MILVDSSVWIDFFRGVLTWQTSYLRGILNRKLVIAGDLILVEILQGFTSEREVELAEQRFATMRTVEIGGRDVALKAARNYRLLRRAGITVRSTIDTLIATRCIVDRIPLLHSDKDFQPFVDHLGLQTINPIVH